MSGPLYQPNLMKSCPADPGVNDKAVIKPDLSAELCVDSDVFLTCKYCTHNSSSYDGNAVLMTCNCCCILKYFSPFLLNCYKYKQITDDKCPVIFFIFKNLPLIIRLCYLEWNSNHVYRIDRYFPQWCSRLEDDMTVRHLFRKTHSPSLSLRFFKSNHVRNRIKWVKLNDYLIQEQRYIFKYAS